MYQDKSIVERSKIQTDCVVVNQCDVDSIEEYKFINKKGHDCWVKFVNTKERGLSRSRNMAINHCVDDICLICDDDEEMADNYEDLILEGYRKYPSASVVAFSILRKDCDRKYPTKCYRIGFSKIFKTNSVQITFLRDKINEHHIRFDVLLGSGTGNGGGEENKFLLDCYYKKLQMYYHTNCIATVLPNSNGGSLWFNGYNEDYIEKMGWSSRRIMGNYLGKMYGIYFVLTHKHKYGSSTNMFGAFKALLRGWGKSI